MTGAEGARAEIDRHITRTANPDHGIADAYFVQER